MTTTIHDIKSSETVSNCCGAPVYVDYNMCANCKEHCEALPIKENQDE